MRAGGCAAAMLGLALVLICGARGGLGAGTAGPGGGWDWGGLDGC